MKSEIDMLREQLAEKDAIIARQERRLSFLEEQFRLAQQQRFGASSEGHSGQAELFDEAEELALTSDDDSAVSNNDTQDIRYTRKKPTRKPLPKDLPREVIVHDIADADKVCACCQGELHKIGEDSSEKLEFIPAQVKVIEHVRPKYTCRTCEKTGTQTTIKQAPVPSSVIPKGYATPSLLSQIITSKYQYGLPLYRQEAMFKQYGIELSRKTMSGWLLKCANLLRPLYDELHRIMLTQSVIAADETTLKVISEDKAKCYMWVYCTGTDSPSSPPHPKDKATPNIVLYDYQNSRAGKCAVNYLKGFTCYLQVDGYIGYEQTQATLAGCWAHARRKFVEAKTAQGKKSSGKADWALNHIQKLYRIETQIKESSDEQRFQVRQDKSTKLLEQFKAWLIKSQSQVIPKSKLGEAITYCLNQWDKLNTFTQNSRINIDNNRAERAVKPFVIGRKNWMFSNTEKGATASAILYSLIETAKANGLTPFDYMMHVLTHISNNQTDIKQLLPWQQPTS